MVFSLFTLCKKPSQYQEVELLFLLCRSEGLQVWNIGYMVRFKLTCLLERMNDSLVMEAGERDSEKTVMWKQKISKKFFKEIVSSQPLLSSLPNRSAKGGTIFSTKEVFYKLIKGFGWHENITCSSYNGKNRKSHSFPEIVFVQTFGRTKQSDTGL